MSFVFAILFFIPSPRYDPDLPPIHLSSFPMTPFNNLHGSISIILFLFFITLQIISQHTFPPQQQTTKILAPWHGLRQNVRYDFLLHVPFRLERRYWPCADSILFFWFNVVVSSVLVSLSLVFSSFLFSSSSLPFVVDQMLLLHSRLPLLVWY